MGREWSNWSGKQGFEEIEREARDLFGEGYPELAGNARCFVETSEVGAAQKFGGRARALVRAHYSWESVADDDEWLFRDLLREAT